VPGGALNQLQQKQMHHELQHGQHAASKARAHLSNQLKTTSMRTTFLFIFEAHTSCEHNSTRPCKCWNMKASLQWAQQLQFAAHNSVEFKVQAQSSWTERGTAKRMRSCRTRATVTMAKLLTWETLHFEIGPSLNALRVWARV
jgi:hypothetical protein